MVGEGWWWQTLAADPEACLIVIDCSDCVSMFHLGGWGGCGVCGGRVVCGRACCVVGGWTGGL